MIRQVFLVTGVIVKGDRICMMCNDHRAACPMICSQQHVEAILEPCWLLKDLNEGTEEKSRTDDPKLSFCQHAH